MLSWKELLHWSEEELARLDLAAVHLACAEGLPGAEELDVAFCLGTLDLWAECVRRYTEQVLPQFHRKPHEYENSEPYFRVLALITVLQRDLGVRYNPAKISLAPGTPGEIEDEFLHGIIKGVGGTCANLPVLYTAVGRRLGYPLRLVRAKRHLFVRWEGDNGERFNIEATNQGLSCFPDDHYRKWPAPFTLEEEEAFGYLKPLSPREELATFVASRGFCLCDRRRYREGLEALVLASALTPDRAHHAACVLGALQDWEKHLRGLYPPRFLRSIEILVRPDRRRFPTIPWEVERHMRMMEAIETCLFEPRYEEWWWGPLRRGLPPLRDVPTSLTVDVTGGPSDVDEPYVGTVVDARPA
jgi:hypothetical protein